MSRDDFSDAIVAVTKDLAETRFIESKHKHKKDTRSAKLIFNGLLWVLLFWLASHFSTELGSILGKVNQDSISNSINQTLNLAAQSIEIYYQENDELPDQLPEEYLRSVTVYTKISDEFYVLSLTFNGVVTKHSYQISGSLAD